MRSEFRDLFAYRRATEIAHELHRDARNWPSFEKWTIGVQLVRAADSVGANIAEASGRWHRPDERRLLLIARGSLHELEHWITYAEERDLLDRGTVDPLADVARALNGLIKRRAGN
jgi:four helix bundle protein